MKYHTEIDLIHPPRECYLRWFLNNWCRQKFHPTWEGCGCTGHPTFSLPVSQGLWQCSGSMPTQMWATGPLSDLVNHPVFMCQRGLTLRSTSSRSLWVLPHIYLKIGSCLARKCSTCLTQLHRFQRCSHLWRPPCFSKCRMWWKYGLSSAGLHGL